MTILWSTQSVLMGLLGGLLIGCSALGMMYFHNRIAGISGLMKGLGMTAQGKVAGAFLAGLVLLPVLGVLAGWISTPSIMDWHPLWLLAAGLAVGLGTGIGNGCTSGHGVCGLARLSVRSLAAVVTFMAAGFLTLAVMRFAGVLS